MSTREGRGISVAEASVRSAVHGVVDLLYVVLCGLAFTAGLYFLSMVLFVGLREAKPPIEVIMICVVAIACFVCAATIQHLRSS